MNQHALDRQRQIAARDSAVIQNRRTNRYQTLENVKASRIDGLLQPVLRQPHVFDLPLSVHASFSTAQGLPPNANIQNSDLEAVFDAAGGRLIITGAHGAGKTTVMLQLAEILIKRAYAYKDVPIPVVINAPAWGYVGGSLPDFMLLAASGQYGIGILPALDMSYYHQFLPLLDAFDEVEPDLRGPLIEAMNAYLMSYPLAGLVLCATQEEPAPHLPSVAIATTIYVGPIQLPQLRPVLMQQDMLGLRTVLAKDNVLQQLARNPFWMTLMADVYAELPAERVALALSEDALAARQADILGRYIAKRLQVTRNLNEYAAADTLRYLSWLADALRRQHFITFFIEDLQPSWAPTPASQVIYRVIATVVPGMFGLLIGLLLPIAGVLLFPLGVLVGWHLPIQGMSPHEFRLNLNTIVTGMAFAVLTWFSTVVFIAEWSVLPASAMMLYGLYVGSVQQSRNTLKRLVPNAGMNRAFENGCMSMAAMMLAVATPLLCLGSAAIGLLWFAVVVPIALGLGITVGFIAVGGRRVLKHALLRLILAINGVIPLWRYDHFLDYAVSLGILRRVGGGYMFRHRYLLEYFAAQYRATTKT